MNASRRHFAVARSAPRPVPPPLRAPFGWPIVAIAADAPLTLTWPHHGRSDLKGGWLRFTTSVDDREDRLVKVRLAASGDVLGVMDLRHAPSLTPCELWLDAPAAAAALREGVVLAVESGRRPLWLLATDLPTQASALAPHLMDEVERRDEARAFFAALASPTSLQPFGGMEGEFGVDDIQAHIILKKRSFCLVTLHGRHTRALIFESFVFLFRRRRARQRELVRTLSHRCLGRFPLCGPALERLLRRSLVERALGNSESASELWNQAQNWKAEILSPESPEITE
jgi:hypothetical protein